MNEALRLLDERYFGNTLTQWAIAAAILVGVLGITLLIRRVARSRYQRLAATPQTEFLELPMKVVSQTTLLFLLVLALYAASTALAMPNAVAKLILTLLTIGAFWQVGIWISTAVTTWLTMKQQQALQHDRAAAGSFSIISFVARGLIWTIVLLLTLDDGEGKQVIAGQCQELVERLEARGACYYPPRDEWGDYDDTLVEKYRRWGLVWGSGPHRVRYSVAYDPDEYKHVANTWVGEAGVRLMYHRWASDIVRDEAGRISHVVFTSKAGSSRRPW